MANKRRDVAKEGRWREALRRFARSGLGVRAFCRLENLPESAFYFWRRELARRKGERSPRSGARLSAGLPGFVPAIVTDPLRGEGLALELAHGRVLRLPQDIPATRLAEIVAALEAAPVSHAAPRTTEAAR